MSMATCLISAGSGMWVLEREEATALHWECVRSRQKRELSELWEWGHVQAVLAVQLWERQAQSAFVSSPSVTKMRFVGTKVF